MQLPGYRAGVISPSGVASTSSGFACIEESRVSQSSSEKDGWILASRPAVVPQSQPMAELVVSISIMS